MSRRHYFASACLGLILGAGAWAATPQIDVTALYVERGSEEDLGPPAVTRVEMVVALPDRQILGLADGSRIEMMRDDTGKVLVGPDVQTAAEAAEAVEGPPGMEVTSRLEGSIRRDAVSVSRDGEYVTVPVVAPILPADDASRLELAGRLIVHVAGDGERTVTLTDVDLDDEWGTELEVDGKRVRCSVDQSTRSGEERLSRLYCYGPDLDPLRIVARGSESIAIESAAGRPNLAVSGELTGLTLDFILPVPEPIEVPVRIELGIGL